MTRASALVSRLACREVSRREIYLLLGAVALGVAVRVAYVVATRDHSLFGDEGLYDRQARWMLDGKWFWAREPFGEPHATAMKPPLYPLLLTALYGVTESGVDKVLLLQTLLLGPPVILLTWILAARLFTAPAVPALASFLAAVYPNMWRWEVRLFPEALALPLGLVLLILVLGGPPTRRRVLLVGIVLGVTLLVRPTSFFFLPGIVVAWWIAAGLRRAALSTALALAVAALVVAPWTVRNYVVLDGFVPLSLQDAGVFGTFNDESANDDRFPYAWRPHAAEFRPLFEPSSGLTDLELHQELKSRAYDYIRDHPDSLIKAFYWNGLTRTWDIRRPANAVLEGRDRDLAYVSLFSYWVLLAAALAALWRLRSSHRQLVLVVLASAVSASVVFTTVAATRYRVPLEPVIVILAASTFVYLYERMSSRTSSRRAAMSAGDTSDSRFSRSSGSVLDGRTLKCQSL